MHRPLTLRTKRTPRRTTVRLRARGCALRFVRSVLFFYTPKRRAAAKYTDCFMRSALFFCNPKRLSQNSLSFVTASNCFYFLSYNSLYNSFLRLGITGNLFRKSSVFSDMLHIIKSSPDDSDDAITFPEGSIIMLSPE